MAVSSTTAVNTATYDRWPCDLVVLCVNIGQQRVCDDSPQHRGCWPICPRDLHGLSKTRGRCTVWASNSFHPTAANWAQRSVARCEKVLSPKSIELIWKPAFGVWPLTLGLSDYLAPTYCCSYIQQSTQCLESFLLSWVRLKAMCFSILSFDGLNICGSKYTRQCKFSTHFLCFHTFWQWKLTEQMKYN
jgi:hypothetical protein